MPGPFEGFRVSRGGPGWHMDWDGATVMAKAVAAAKTGIDECMALGVEHARSGHQYPPPSEDWQTFANRTEQTIDATQILEKAELKGEFGPRPYVTGRWGVRDEPAYQDPDEWREVRGFKHPERDELQDVTIMDRAMFLEFGTRRMAPRPFLYPAWDETKHLLPGLIAAAYKALGGGRWRGI
jgi:hypothetical protein